MGSSGKITKYDSKYRHDIKKKLYILCLVCGNLQILMLQQDKVPGACYLGSLPWTYWSVMLALLQIALFCALTSRLRPSLGWGLTVWTGKMILTLVHAAFWAVYQNEPGLLNFGILLFTVFAYSDIIAVVTLRSRNYEVVDTSPA